MYCDKNQRDFARHLRNNMTDAERRLWRLLRCQQLKGFKFRRQAAIENYVVDFVCFSQKVIMELDGGQHNQARAKDYDNVRTQLLASRGFRVLRFWNHEIFENEDGVAEVIWRALSEATLSQASPPSPALPAEGRETA
jgi:very-short-patch-repair endonuclease